MRTLSETLFDTDINDEELLMTELRRKKSEKDRAYVQRIKQIFNSYGYTNPTRFEAKPFIVLTPTYGFTCIEAYDPENEMAYGIIYSEMDGSVNADIHKDTLASMRAEFRSIRGPHVYMGSDRELIDMIIQYAERHKS